MNVLILVLVEFAPHIFSHIINQYIVLILVLMEADNY